MGTRARGRAYERSFAQHVAVGLGAVGLGTSALRVEQWIRFGDSSGAGYAQVDSFLILPPRLVLFECKLTRHAAAEVQLNHLYGPLLREIYPGLEQIRVAVFKNPGKGYVPHPEAPHSLRTVLELEPPVYAEWHWIG